MNRILEHIGHANISNEFFRAKVALNRNPVVRPEDRQWAESSFGALIDKCITSVPSMADKQEEDAELRFDEQFKSEPAKSQLQCKRQKKG